MKKITRNATVMLIIGMLLVLLTGCSEAITANAEKSPEALAIIVGNHSCSRELNLNSPKLLERVSTVIENYGFISVISVDGSPSLASADLYDIPDRYKNAVKSKLEADAENKARNLMTQIKEVRADDEEVDTLKALRLAVGSFDDAPENASREIFIIDTGWSTTGLLDFGNNLLGGEPEAIAEILSEKNALPDLSGVKVNWRQLGEVAAPQQELSPSQTQALKDIWRAIIEKGGGTVEFKEGSMNGSTDGNLPRVSPVDLPEEEPVQFDAENLVMDETLFDQPVFFSEEQVRFQGDSDAYAEPEKAMQSMKPIAEYMNTNTDFRLLLAGTTAGDEDNQYVRKLSYARANAVKNSLMEMGVPGARLIVVGLGNQDPWHIHGAGISGRLAAQNRKVVLISADTEEAVELQQEFMTTTGIRTESSHIFF